MPASGFTPEEMAKAMANGNATSPTVTPAMRSAMNVRRVKSPKAYAEEASNRCGKIGIKL
jgi:hypothetical protein